jgi:hypothetical protein
VVSRISILHMFEVYILRTISCEPTDLQFVRVFSTSRDALERSRTVLSVCNSPSTWALRSAVSSTPLAGTPRATHLVAPNCCMHGVYTPPQESQQLPTVSLTRRSVLISKIYAAAALMGNDHILSLRTGDALVQRRAPALG